MGGSINITNQFNDFITYINAYTIEELVLDGLKYFQFYEKVEFDSAQKFQFNLNDLIESRIDLPCYIIDECAHILNQLFDTKIH